MKLYNRTRIPDEVLRALLVKAGRSVGARTGNVAVSVNPTRRYSVGGGCAYNYDLLRVRARWVRVDGYFKISLGVKSSDPLLAAQAFLHTARHEFGHIRDYQSSEHLEFSRRGPGGRRPLHDSRPEEIRAEDYIYDSDQRLCNKPGYFDEEVLALAIEIEKLNKS